MTRGKFVVFEGADGAGKSTQLTLTAQWLRERGIKVATSREPGGTPVGEQLRALALGASGRIDKTSELFVMLAARRENVCRVITPALMRGEWLLCDRFGDSTRAYQGGGRGIDDSLIECASAAAEVGVKPDMQRANICLISQTRFLRQICQIAKLCHHCRAQTCRGFASARRAPSLCG